MIKLKKNKDLIFLTLASLLFLPIALRDNYNISDALNYIEHARKGFDISDVATYFSLAYWLLMGFLGYYFEPDFTPSILSLLVSACIIFSSLKLRNKDRWIFLFFCIYSAVIFNTTQVALRNGLALGFLLLYLAYGRMFLLLASPLFHPGVLPIFFILLFLSHATSVLKIIIAIICVSAVAFFLMPYFGMLLDLRGYTQDGASSLAGPFTYVAVAMLSGVFYLSLPHNPYRFFMPIVAALWLFVGNNYEFGGRLFFQSMILSLFIVLNESRIRKFKSLYLFLFLIFTLYGSFLWHPLFAYYDGWFGYWAEFL